MKTATQIIRAFLFSPDQHPGDGTSEFEAVCQDARDFLAMEQEVQEARALTKLARFDEAEKKLDETWDKHGVTEPALAAEQFLTAARLAQHNLKLASMLKEALEIAAQADDDFYRDNRGPARLKEIAEEASQL